MQYLYHDPIFINIYIYMYIYTYLRASQVVQLVKNPPAKEGDTGDMG